MTASQPRVGVTHLEWDGEGLSTRSPSRRLLPSRRLAIASAILLASAGLLFMRLHGDPRTPRRAEPRTAKIASAATPSLPPLPIPPPDLLRAMTAAQAVAANMGRPVIVRPDTAAAGFRLTGDAISRLRAIDCLSQAVYYEAASEGIDGGRAVAQVVLNRLGHPAYPHTVCGVVYQGADRPTGCQFTFTCDGSLARPPAGYLWQRSRMIAREALAGQVFKPIGHATSYHADYVLPYWADSLDKVAVVGRHIFYRLKGGAGARSVFVARYAGAEPPPPPPANVLPIDLAALNNVKLTAPIVGEATVAADQAASSMPEVERAGASEPESRLAADLMRGQLIVGDAPTSNSPAPRQKARRADACPTSLASRLRPVAADDLKAGVSNPAC